MENLKKKKTWSSVYRKLALVNRHGIFSSSLVSLLKSFPHFVSFVAYLPLFFAQCTLRWLLSSGVQFLYICLSLLLFFVLAYWCHISDSVLQIRMFHEVVTFTLYRSVMNLEMYKLHILWTVRLDTYSWEKPTRCTLFLINFFQLNYPLHIVHSPTNAIFIKLGKV